MILQFKDNKSEMGDIDIFKQYIAFIRFLFNRTENEYGNISEEGYRFEKSISLHTDVISNSLIIYRRCRIILIPIRRINSIPFSKLNNNKIIDDCSGTDSDNGAFY